MATIKNLVDSLWECRVAIQAVDIAAARVVLAITRDGRERRLRLEGVTSFSLVLAIGELEPWDYAEASEVGLVGPTTLDMVLWDEPNSLRVAFTTAYLDDELVTP